MEAERIIVEENEKYRQDFLLKNLPSKSLETTKEKVAKIAYLLILTGPACTALINCEKNEGQRAR